MQHLGSLNSSPQNRRRKLADWIHVVGGIGIALLIVCLALAAVFPRAGACLRWAFYFNAVSMTTFLGLIIGQLFIEWVREWMTPIP